MDEIVKQINKPEWWFTVVVVGLIVGVVAAFAKDWVSSLLSKVSVRFSEYDQRREKAKKTEIELLASNIQLLIVEYIRAAFLLAASVAFMFFSSFLPIWSVLKKKFPEVDPLSSMLRQDKFQEWFGLAGAQTKIEVIMIIVAGMIGLFFWMKFLNNLILCEMARSKLRHNQ